MMQEEEKAIMLGLLLNHGKENISKENKDITFDQIAY